MPIHVFPRSVSRRRFLTAFLALSGTRSVFRSMPLKAAQPSGSGAEAWALLSDTHIAGDPALNARGINMADHLRQAVAEVLENHASQPFAGLLVNGDCAYLDGQAEDYRVLGGLLQPVPGAGIPVHLTLGNHDERNRIQEALLPGWTEGRAGADRRARLEDRIASRIPGRFCDWYLLDSLEFTNKTSGRIGEAQLAWLRAALDQAPGRPALVMVHHNPDPGAEGRVSGLRDTGPLLELLTGRRQVKALFFGHTHVASVTEKEGLHLVNLPACAYRFGAGQPTGWTMLTLEPGGCQMRLFDTEKAHPLHGHEVRLAWRS